MAGLLVRKQQPSACCGLVTFIRVTAKHSLWLGYFYMSNSQTITVAGLPVYNARALAVAEVPGFN